MVEICTSNEHCIKISNVNSGEEICHSVLLVEGIIESTNNDCKAPMAVTIEQISGLLCNPPTTIHKVSSNMSFKCLLKLDLGMNKFIIKFCLVEKEIIFYFKPRQTNFCVVPIFVICKGHDGRFQAPAYEDNSIESACERISTGIQIIQSLFAERLQRGGYGRLTFQLLADIDQSAPDCHVFYSDISVKDAHNASADTLWTWLAREIMLSKLGSKERKYVAFLSSTHYNGSKVRKGVLTHEETLQSTQGYVSLGGGGLALMGTGCLHTWAPSIEEVIPRLLNAVAVDKTQFMDESNYRGTYGGCYSTTLGAAAHEMGHTFDLGHNAHGLMGLDYHNIHDMLVTEETSVSPVKSVAENYSQQMQLDKNLSLGKGDEEYQKLLNISTGKERCEELVPELQVVWSLPKSQISCKTTCMLKSDNTNTMSKFEKHRNTAKHCSGMSTEHHQYETSGEKDFFRPTFDRDDASPFWPESCISILSFHKWFNPDATTDYSGDFHFDPSQKQISSEYGLGVIEIRDSESQSILHWKFPRESLPKTFNIPEHYIYPNSHILWVIDQVGNSKAFDLKK
ncbi:Putative zinc metalloproteinase YIL108W [Frankliniella fusca]|uniref:Zinc metalloproteinase YIL108W n=1 Tax=Frankliniella fusca TaxID=407009 RepID=A0AAE1H976_9NEOP|nr:Putative zinc metalloproteinase YIL108W [Frankliniella fusca]